MYCGKQKNNLQGKTEKKIGQQERIGRVIK